MKIGIISVTSKGAQTAQQLRRAYGRNEEGTFIVTCYEKNGRQSGEEAYYFDSLKDEMEMLWYTYDRLLFIMSTGIVVRMIAPYVKHKSEDPAILVMDEGNHFVISLLSGHLGGANEWAQEVSAMVEATPVITTATDVNKLPAPDVLARKCHMTVEDFSMLIKVNSAIVAGEQVHYYLDDELSLEYEEALMSHGVTWSKFHGYDMIKCSNDSISTINIKENEKSIPWGDEPKVIITDKIFSIPGVALVLRPKTMTVGIGCRRDTPKELILEAITDSLSKQHRSMKSVLGAASVIVKADEVGLLEAMKELQWGIRFYTQEEMIPFVESHQLTESSFVKGTIGVGNVSETTALLLAEGDILWQNKTIYPRTTVAIASVNLKLSALGQVIKNL